ncbi:hypothetical protein AB1Y20_010402 [Prymnesium parvum]|uniref:Uncharacterized protein n=1 Tax=Prymnesium parvum TaxID=97485 RepID=A0AB34INJ0_PRYPA
MAVLLASPLLSAGRPPVKHFINLSNGIEALEPLARAGLAADSVSFVRVQSSHCEARDFDGILSSLDHNLLMHLALGFECRVYDYGSRGNVWENARGEAELRFVPRALWWGLEWARYALHTLWRLPPAREPPTLRGVNVQSLFDAQMRKLPKPLGKRLKYYRPYVAADLAELRLRCFYAETDLDGNREAYGAMLRRYASRAAVSELTHGPPPEPGELGLYEFDRRARRGEGSVPPHTLKRRS